MLKRQNRLTSNRAFRATYKNNKTVSAGSIVLYLGHEKNDKNCPTRVGFVVSKKIHKRAVVRNKIKRAIRENIRIMLKNNTLCDKFQSLIFVVKSDISDKTYQEIKNIVENLVNKLANKNI